MIIWQRRAGERGSASIEMVALVPMVMLVMILVFQVAAAAYTAQGASQAARDAARAYSLGQSPLLAAEASVPGGVRVIGVDRVGYPNHGIRVVVEGPAVQVIGDRRVTREVIMP